MADDAKKLIDFGNYIGGDEALASAARAVRSLQKDFTAFGKVVSDDSGRVTAGLAAINEAISAIQSKAVKLTLISPEDKKLLADYIKQVGDLRAAQADYQATQAAQKQLQTAATEAIKQATSELGKQKQALRDATAANDVEAQKKAAAQIRDTTLANNDLSKALRGATSELTAAKGSYDALVLENNKLLASLHGLEGGLAAGSQEAQKLKQQIFDNTETLKLFDAETNRNFRNVGNYAQSFSGLVAELAKARAAQAGLTEGTTLYAQNQQRIIGFQTAAQKSAADMGLSYEQAEAKINGAAGALAPLATRLTSLEREQLALGESTGQESTEYQKLGFQIQSTKKQLDEVAVATTKAEQTQQGLGEQLGFSKQGLAQFAVQLAVGAVGLQALSQAATAVFESNLAFSDQLADVRKTTGLTADEADRLAASLKNLDTRTSLEGLLGIANVGGQLGIAKGDILEFTKAVDIANQALGAEFGGDSEQLATELGKISGVFRKELGPDVAQNLLSIGSAINQIGADGAATAPFLADVSLRVGAIAASTGVGLKNVLAYGAVLQETGYSAETSGTALNKLFSTLSTKTEASFRIAQQYDPSLTLKEFTRLVNTDFNAAITLFLKGLNQGGQSTTDLSKELATLKLQSGEAKSVIVTLAQNTELFAERQQTANDQLRDATSLGEFATIKNETLAASYEKLKNSVSNFFTNGAVGGFFRDLIDLTRQNVDVLEGALGKIGAGINYVKEQLGLSEPPLVNYAAATLNATLALNKQAGAQQKLLDAYKQLEGLPARTGAQELELSNLRQRLGAADVATIQAGIDKQREQAAANKANLEQALTELNAAVETGSQRAARAQDALGAAAADKDAAELARIREIATARLDATNPLGGRSSVPELEPAIAAATQLTQAERALAEAQRNRTNVLEALKKLGAGDVQQKAEATEAAEQQTAAEAQLDRAAQERAKNRVSALQDELADNQRRIAAARAYLAEQGKLFADRQLSGEVLAQRTAGAEDLITQAERDGAALRIKIARAEAADKLEAAENDRIRQSQKKKITEQELADIQGQYAARRAEIFRKEGVEILKIQQDLRDKLKIEPLEFKVTEFDETKYLEDQSRKFLLTYQRRVSDIKAVQSAADGENLQALANKEITENQYEKRRFDNQRKADEEELTAAKLFNKNVLDAQKKVNQDIIDEQDRLKKKRVEIIERVGQEAQQIESAFYGVKANLIDADIQRTQASYDAELAAAGDNAALKTQIQKKYDKELKKLNYDKAKSERDAAAISVAIQTAVAVAKAIAESPETIGLPFSAIALINGALQEAVILSKPLPAYFKGRRGGKAELAQVAERGPELIERVGQPAHQRFEYVATRQIARLGAGDNVYTAEDTSLALARIGLNQSQASEPLQLARAFAGAAQGAKAAREQREESGYAEVVKGQQAIVRAIENIKPTSVTVHRGSDADVETSKSLTRYFHQRTGR